MCEAQPSSCPSCCLCYPSLTKLHTQWKHALPDPRIVTIKAGRNYYGHSAKELYLHPQLETLKDFIEVDDKKFTQTYQNLLYTSRDSRKVTHEALQQTRIIFSELGKPLVFNDKTDTLRLIDSTHLIAHAGRVIGGLLRDLKTVQHVEIVNTYGEWDDFLPLIHMGLHEYDFPSESDIFQCFKHFRKIKNLHIHVDCTVHLVELMHQLEQVWEVMSEESQWLLAESSRFVRRPAMFISLHEEIQTYR